LQIARLLIRKVQAFHVFSQVEQRRKNLFPVLPKPPEGYKDYLMNRKTYLLHDFSGERLKSFPKAEPPPELPDSLKDLFAEQVSI
jgi:hypothetical protein